MPKLTENSIEQSFIEQLVNQGYDHCSDIDISPTSDKPQRESWNVVLLEKHFKQSLKKLNPDVPESARVEAYQKVINLGAEDIMENNERFHSLLTTGVTVDYTKDGRTTGIDVQLLDVKNPENNSFWAVNQFVVKENNNEKRFDVVLFINGLPLVFVELKNATDEKATIHKAYTQIQNYKKAVPSIFYYNAVCVISDGIDAASSSVSAPFSRYLPWKAPKESPMEHRTQLQILTEYMLNKKTLVELIRYYTVFEKSEEKNAETGIITQVRIKKVAAYHQYYVVQKAVEQTIRATHSNTGNRKIGVVWHTQGSGKSLSMLFYSGKMVVHPEMGNPTLVILTDRNDLDEQLFSTFGNCIGLLRKKPVQAKSREHIKELLKVAGGGVIFTTIQKFYPEEGNVYDTLSERSNIVVMADEAHRSQYGFKANEVEVEGTMKTRYGNAKYLRDALPKASYIGFTGTPIEKEDKSTPAVFGDYIDVYDIKQAVDDGATVPINYEARLIKLKLEQGMSKYIDDEIDNILGATEEQLEKAKKKTAKIDSIVGHTDRLKDLSEDIVTHFEERQKVLEGKAMIVGMTRNICVNLYNMIISLRPDWHHDDLDKGAIKVIMTSSSSDPESFQPHHTSKQQRKNLATRMRDPHDSLKLVIVRDMWLTGFDVPCLHTMYIDKKMQGANLMQTIARVNRVYKDKPGGLIVDYLGIGQHLRKAMKTYLESGGKGSVANIKEVIAGMKEKFDVVEKMFKDFDYKAYFTAETGEKLQILLGAQNFILSDTRLKERYLKEVTNLSKFFAMVIPNAEAEKIRDEVSFFQAVKTRINKFSGSGATSDYEVETAIKQIIDDALASDGVIDIFEIAGVNRPAISILSDEFLLEVKNMPHPNVAFELLKKLLNDEVKTRSKKNLVQGKKFSEMLNSAIKRYQNNQIDSAQVIEELSNIAKDMRLEDHKSEELGLTPEEYAFYSILKENESTSFLKDEKMKKLIHTIVDAIRQNATVDWDKRDDVKATLRLVVKKILVRYGYPPDLARMEADKVLKQSEAFAGDLFSAEV